MKKIYFIRHCKAMGQEQSASLTTEGERQSIQLVDYFNEVSIDAIYSSPFKRTIDSVKPLSIKKQLPIFEDERLTERQLSSENLPNWYEHLQESFSNMSLKLPGGESNIVAQQRGISAVKDILNEEYQSSLVVTHGNLLTVILNYFDSSFGFKEWEKLSNPDIYLLRVENHTYFINRVWNS